MAGRSITAAVIRPSDPASRQVVAEQLLASMSGPDAAEQERARKIFINHGYLDETTARFRSADSAADRAAAAYTLGIVGSRLATAHLVAGIFDSAPEVCRAAAAALAKIGDPAVSMAPLNQLIDSKSDQTTTDRSVDLVSAEEVSYFETEAARVEPELVMEPPLRIEPELSVEPQHTIEPQRSPEPQRSVQSQPDFRPEPGVWPQQSVAPQRSVEAERNDESQPGVWFQPRVEPDRSSESGPLVLGIDLADVPPEIVAGLKSSLPRERIDALDKLTRSGAKATFRLIVNSFADASDEVRNAAARALYVMDPEHCAESFGRAIDESTTDQHRNTNTAQNVNVAQNINVAENIGRALAASGVADKAIEDLAGDNREDAYNSLCLLFAMAKTGEIQPLINAIEQHSSSEVRRAAVKLLTLNGQAELAAAAAKRRLMAPAR